MTIMEYAHRHPDDFAARVAGLVFVATTAEGHTHTCYGLPPRVSRLLRLAETTGAGVLARCGGWRTPGPLLQALRPTLRWLLFGDDCTTDDIRLTTSAVARASLRLDRRASVLDRCASTGWTPWPRSATCRRRRWSATGTGSPRRACAESIADALPGHRADRLSGRRPHADAGTPGRGERGPGRR